MRSEHFQVLQGSVETLIRWGGKRLHHLIGNLFRKPCIKFHENRPSFVWDITKNILVSFFLDTLYYIWATFAHLLYRLIQLSSLYIKRGDATDNVPARTSSKAAAATSNDGFELHHPSYLSYLAPSDFYLFPARWILTFPDAAQSYICFNFVARAKFEVAQPTRCSWTPSMLLLDVHAVAV